MVEGREGSNGPDDEGFVERSGGEESAVVGELHARDGSSVAGESLEEAVGFVVGRWLGSGATVGHRRFWSGVVSCVISRRKAEQPYIFMERQREIRSNKVSDLIY